MEHLLAHLLPLQHQVISGWAAGILRRRRALSTDTHRRMVTFGTIPQINDTELPFPLVEGAESVEEFLLPVETEIADLLGAVRALEAVEVLALNLEGVADAGIP